MIVFTVHYQHRSRIVIEATSVGEEGGYTATRWAPWQAGTMTIAAPNADAAVDLAQRRLEYRQDQAQYRIGRAEEKLAAAAPETGTPPTRPAPSASASGVR